MNDHQLVQMDYSQQDADFTNHEGTIYQENSLEETPPGNNPINNPKSLTSEDNYLFGSPGQQPLRNSLQSNGGSFKVGRDIQYQRANGGSINSGNQI